MEPCVFGKYSDLQAVASLVHSVTVATIVEPAIQGHLDIDFFLRSYRWLIQCPGFLLTRCPSSRTRVTVDLTIYISDSYTQLPGQLT